MKIKFIKKNRQFLINAFIICSFLSIIIIYFLHLLLPNKSVENIATTVAGILGTTFSFFGSVLVFFALNAQIEANEQVRKQFEKENFDNNFFRLIDNIEKRIINSEIKHLVGDEVEKSYAILNYLIEQINKKKISYKNIFGKHILETNPKCLEDDMWKKFYSEIDGNKYDNWENLKNVFLEAESSKRTEIITHDVIYFEESYEFDSFINDIFEKYFYLQSDEFYDSYYHRITFDFFKNYPIFFDGYYKSISMTLKHIDSIENNKFYIDYLTEALTTYEKIIIWFAVSTRKFGIESRTRIHKFNILFALNNITGIQSAQYNPNYYDHVKQRLMDKELEK